MSDVQSAQPMLSPGHHCDLTRGDSTEKDGGPPDVLSKLATLALIVTVAISCTASAKCMRMRSVLNAGILMSLIVPDGRRAHVESRIYGWR